MVGWPDGRPRRKNACQVRSTVSASTPAGGPQPQRVRAAVAGQVINGQPDEGALDDQQVPVVVFHPPREASRWCSHPQAMAVAVPYRVVWVLVVTAGMGQDRASASSSAAPCRGGRPPRPAGSGHSRSRTPPGCPGCPHASARRRSAGLPHRGPRQRSPTPPSPRPRPAPTPRHATTSPAIVRS